MRSSVPLVKDLASVDEPLHRSLAWILDNHIGRGSERVVEVTFSVTERQFGSDVTVDLIKDGQNVDVDEDNKRTYVELLTQYKLKTAINEQLEALRKGLFTVIPPSLLAVFDAQELELLLNGRSRIDIDDWKNHTNYGGTFTPNCTMVEWFWEVVENDMTDEELSSLLQFSTGTRRLPVEGFRGLESNRGQSSPFTIVSHDATPLEGGTAGRLLLPKAQTCFNRLLLPTYESKEALLANLRLCMEFGIQGFDDDP
eukprot:Selendium_serpulae@DN4740_c0_g1_i1.p1